MDKETGLAFQWAKTFARGISDAVVILDDNYLILWWNTIAERLFGLKGDSDERQSILKHIQSDQFVTHMCSHKGGTFEMPSPVLPHVILSVVLIPSNQLVLLVAQDISHQRHIDKMRHDFVANVSHEIRTPLTVLQGYLELMEPDVAESLPQWSESVTEMKAQAYRMESLLEELLLLAKLENPDEDNSSHGQLAVSEVLKSLMSDAEQISGGKHQFRLNVKDDVELFGNAKELRSCFGNLIFNAIRYSPDGGGITITAWKTKNSVHVQVKDQGIGIPQKHIPRLTERFYRVDKGRSRATGGTGLGLSIVKHVLIRHRAELLVESEFGKGSCFTCVFPLS